MIKALINAIALLAAFIFGGAPACAADKMALLIGYSSYPGQLGEAGKWSVLPNAVRDVDLIRKSLEQVGFEVHIVPERGSLSERSKDIFWKAVGVYATAAATARISVVYYSGHGIEFRRRNYIVPVDAPALTDDARIGEDFIDLDEVADLVSSARVNLFFIDACRNGSSVVKAGVPLAAGPAKPVNDIEFARGKPAIVVYSTARGEAALDAAPPPSDNSPFALAFAEIAVLPRLDVNSIADGLVDGVKKRTERFSPPQQPYPYGKVDNGYYFAEKAPTRVAQAASPPPASVSIDRRDLETLDAPLLVMRVMLRYSLDDLERLGEEGDPNAAYVLAYMHSAGLGVKRDLALARSWAEKPSLQATWYGKLRLADQLFNREGSTGPEKARALELYRQAADSRVGKAMGQYAYILMKQGFENRDRVPYDKGLAILRESADLGYPYGMYAIAKTDNEPAAGTQTSRLRALAEAGNVAAGEWLCDLAARRNDHVEALRICTLAAKAGSTIAQARLAIAYHDGLGVPVSADDAKHWARLALDDQKWNHDDLRQKLLGFGYSFVRETR